MNLSPPSSSSYLCTALCIAMLLFSSAHAAKSGGGEKKTVNENTASGENVQDFDHIDTDGDQSLSREEFEKWYNGAHSAAASDGKKASAVFNSYDLDANGKLTVGEFVPLAYVLSRKPLEAEENLFKRLDLNSDKILSKEELEKAGEDLSRDLIQGLLLVADSNHDGHISHEEYERVEKDFNGNKLSAAMKSAQEARGMAQSLIGSMDGNKNGWLSEADIYSFAKRFSDNNKASPSTVQQLFQRLDTNGDRKLTADELEKHPEQLALLVGVHLSVPSVTP